MMFKKRKKLEKENEKLRAEIKKLEELREREENMRGLLAQQARTVVSQKQEIDALDRTIDGMEKDLNRKKEMLAASERQRKDIVRRERELRLAYEILAEDIQTIERDGLCCLCREEASKAACGVTCCFRYKRPLLFVEGRK